MVIPGPRPILHLRSMWWKAIAVWSGLMVLAILNGALRQKLIIPQTGEAIGHVISTVLLCLLLIGASWLSIGWVMPRTFGHTWAIGLLWLAMTLTFEFRAGHYLFKKPWPELLADYNVLRGRIWVLVLITTLVAPTIAVWMRAR